MSAVEIVSAEPCETIKESVPSCFDGEKEEAQAKKLTPMEQFKHFWSTVLEPERAADIIATKEQYEECVVWGTQNLKWPVAITKPLAPYLAATDNYFRITERGTSFYTEFVGGWTTFFAMCYIIVLNGVILNAGFYGTAYGTGVSSNGSVFSTCLASGLFTTVMGLFANVPIALAPGMGLNGYFATVSKVCAQNTIGDGKATDRCPSWGKTALPYTDALGAIFLSGIFYLFFTFTGLRAMLFRAVPKSVRMSIAVGIGFFITCIGLRIGQIMSTTIAYWYAAGPIAKHAARFEDPINLNFAGSNMGIANFKNNAAACLSVLGIVFTAGLTLFKVPGAIILSIMACTIIGINMGRQPTAVEAKSLDHTYTDDWYKPVTDLNYWNRAGGMTSKEFVIDVSQTPAGNLTWRYASTLVFWDAVWTFLFVELFDSFGTITACINRCGFLLKDPEMAEKRINRAMMVDGFSLAFGAIIGSNSMTCYIESATGIEAGARTGLASVWTGVAFLFSLVFVKPFVQIIPDSATCCALVMVGVHSFDQVREIDFSDFINSMVAFLTVATMGFTYSIANGICAGFIWFAYMRTLRWIQVKYCERNNCMEKYGPPAGVETDLPHPLMFAMAVFMAIRFAYLSF